MQSTETTIEEEISAVKEIVQSTKDELSLIPGAIKDAEALIKSCDDNLLQLSHHNEQQRQSLTIAAAQLHDAKVAYDAALDYLDAAAGRTGENAAVHDLRVKKELYDAAKLNYQKEQQMYDQAIAKSSDLQKEYACKRAEAQSLIDEKHKQRGSLQSAHNQATQRLGRLLHQRAHDRIESRLSSLGQKEKEVIQAEADLHVAIEEESTVLLEWPSLRSTILSLLPYSDAFTSILERYRAFLNLLLQERSRCQIDPTSIQEYFHNFDLSLLLELSQGDISAALSDPTYGISPSRIIEKLQDTEKLLQVYRDKH